MSEEIFIDRKDVVSREHALARAQAAEEIGGIAVHILQNEGESYRHMPSRHSAQRVRRTEGVVSEGMVRIETSGMFPKAGTGELNRRTDELEAELHQQKAA